MEWQDFLAVMVPGGLTLSLFLLSIKSSLNKNNEDIWEIRRNINNLEMKNIRLESQLNMLYEWKKREKGRD